MKSKARSCIRTRAGLRAFTLIEILMVMAIMSLMMALAMVAFVDWGRDAKVRAATQLFRNTFNLARQHAITHRQRTYLSYGNRTPPGGGVPPNRGWFVVSTNLTAGGEPDGLIGTYTEVSDGVLFTNDGAAVSTVFEFKLDGSCDADCNNNGTASDDWDGNQRSVVIFEGGRESAESFIARTVTVFQLTGTILPVEE